jgi:hypothetical protein
MTEQTESFQSRVATPSSANLTGQVLEQAEKKRKQRIAAGNKRLQDLDRAFRNAATLLEPAWKGFVKSGNINALTSDPMFPNYRKCSGELAEYEAELDARESLTSQLPGVT